MRLRRFDLTRYGRFTDFALDFGPRRAGKADFHIVYGPNEAGKSTLRNAFLDFLFGIEKQSGYNFLHPYPSMRIGGLIETDAAAHALMRVKRDKNDLLDADDRPVSEALLPGLLGAIDRAGYETMFSLDDDSLQEGGESILQSEGDLGRLLFSAASGLADFGAIVDAVKADAAEFYRPNARKHRLNEARHRLKELKDRAAEIDVQARDYDVLTTAEATARDLYEKAAAARDEARKRFERLRRTVEALRPWRDLRALRLELEPLGDLPDLPHGWLAEAQALSRAQAAALAERAAARTRVEALEADLDAIVPDAVILACESRFAGLKQREARYISAEDIAARRRELAAVEQELAGLMQRLGRDKDGEPERLVLPAVAVGVLDDLLARRPVLASDREAATREAEKAGDRVMTAETTLAACGDATDRARLETAAAQVRDAAFGKEISALQRRRDRALRDLDDGIAVLVPWSGDGEALFRLPIPDARRIAEWKSAFAALDAEASDLRRELADRQDARTELAADRDAQAMGAEGIDDEAAGQIRERRDAAWRAHRSVLHSFEEGAAAPGPADLAGSADAFEAALSADDGLAAARFGRASDVVNLRRIRADLVRADAMIAALEEKAESLGERRRAAAQGLEAAVTALGLPRDTDAGFLEIWLERREAALVRRAELAEAEGELRQVRDAQTAAAGLLHQALIDAGVDADPASPVEDLLAQAQAEIERARSARVERTTALKALEEAKRDARDRERAVQRAEDNVQEWNVEWSDALAGTWLAEAERPAAPAAMREVLKCLAEISVRLEKREELKHRILAMAEDRQAYETAVEALAREAGEAYEPADVLKIAETLTRRLTGAVQKRARFAEKQAELVTSADALQRAAEKADAIAARFDEMRRRFPAQDVPDLLRMLESAGAKAALIGKIAATESDLADVLECASLAEAETHLAEIATDEEALAGLKAEWAGAEQELKSSDSHVETLFHEWKSAQSALNSVDGDAAVARIEEERRTLLLDIEAQAERYLTLSIGALVAENALSTYRDRHRNSMMRRAASAFATITRGGFADLITTPGKNSEVLVGVRADGGSMLAAEMSKGTRFQLYLALRIAGHAEFAEHRSALPFFADDIMETFDDDRSAETFQLLSGMADKGQVIYLTHHRHLCDIARTVCGDNVVLHTLPDPDRSSRPARAAE